MKSKLILPLILFPFLLGSCDLFTNKVDDLFKNAGESFNGDLYFNDVVVKVDATNKKVSVSYKEFSSEYVTIDTVSDKNAEYSTSDSMTNVIGVKTTVDHYWYMYSINLRYDDKKYIVGVLQDLIDAQIKEKAENGSTNQDIIFLYNHKVSDVCIGEVEKRVDNKFERRNFTLYAVIGDSSYSYYNGNGIYRFAPEN